MSSSWFFLWASFSLKCQQRFFLRKKTSFWDPLRPNWFLDQDIYEVLMTNCFKFIDLLSRSIMKLDSRSHQEKYWYRVDKWFLGSWTLEYFLTQKTRLKKLLYNDFHVNWLFAQKMMFYLNLISVESCMNLQQKTRKKSYRTFPGKK